MRLLLGTPTGRVNVRGGNGSGKSTLLAALKSEIKNRAYYWPTSDRLAFEFALKDPEPGEEEAEEPKEVENHTAQAQGLLLRRTAIALAAKRSSHMTDAPIYLLDEWDANLDAKNRAAANALVEQLAARARVIEISHRDAA